MNTIWTPLLRMSTTFWVKSVWVTGTSE